MKLTKTTALKASLLLVLAANMSWEQIDFGSVELAVTGDPREQVSSAGAGTATPSAAAAPTSVSPVAASVRVAGAAPDPVAMKIETAAAAEKLTPMSHTSDKHLLVCGDKYEISYLEEERAGQKKTRVSATRLSNREDGLEIVVPRKTLDLIGDQDSTYARLTREIKAMRADKKQTCAGDTTTTVADTKTAEEKKTIDDQVKNCKTDKEGTALKSDKIIACWTKQVAQVEKRVDKKDSDGKRVSEKERERALYAEITRIARILKTDIKRGLLSKDESRVEEAREQLTAAMEAIVAGGTSLGGDDERGYDNKISKIIAEFEALDKAADTRKEALALKERAEDMKREMRESYLGVQSARDLVLREPLNQQALADLDRAKFDLQQMGQQYNLLRTEIGRDFEQDELRRLQQYKSSRLITNADFNDFVKPYTELQKLLKDAVAAPATVSATQSFTGKITGSVLGDDYAVPTNLSEFRTKNGAIAARTLGTALPTARPTVVPSATLQAPRPTF